MILSERVSGGRPVWGVVVAMGLAMSALPAWSLAQQKDATKEDIAKESDVNKDYAKEPAEKTVTISAKVVDDQGQSIAGAQIWWTRSSSLDALETTTSDENGRFSVSPPEKLLDPWGHLWIFKADKQVAVIQTWRKPEETAITLRRMRLSNEPASEHMIDEVPDGVIRMEPAIDNSYRVLAPDGSPAVGIEVEPKLYLMLLNYHGMFPDPVRAMLTVKTDADGWAKFPNLARQWLYSLDLHSTDWGQQRQSWLNDARSGLVDNTIQLKTPGRIEGQLEASHPEWTRGATLLFETRDTGTTGTATATTDQEGRFVVPSIVPGKLTVRCKVAEGVTALPRLPTDQRVPEGGTLQLKFRLSPSAVVRGVVRTQDMQAPVPGAEVSIGFGNGQSALAVTDAEGRYEARVLLGKISRMYLTNYPPDFRHYRLMGARPEKEIIVDDYEVPFELPPIELSPLVSVSGKLIDQDGNPIPLVEVNCEEKRDILGHGVTNKQGEFEAWVPKGASPDNYSITILRRMRVPEATVVQRDPLILRVQTPIGEIKPPVRTPRPGRPRPR